MNKALTTNIGGFLFNIEEIAYELLLKYLSNIRRELRGQEEQEEILQDIEYRIAELFKEKLSKAKEVIDTKDVEDIIATLGNPSVFGGDHAENDQEPETEATAHKRIFRDGENARLGGVCAGIAAFFGIDPVIVRIIFVILAIFSIGVLLYLIFYFVIPEAKTTSEKLQMKGHSINIENIRNQWNNVESKIKKAKTSTKFDEFVNAFIRNFKPMFTVIGQIIGFGFLLTGIILLLLVLSLIFRDIDLLYFSGFEEIYRITDKLNLLLPSDIQSEIFLTAVLLMAMVPIISILTTGLKLIFSLRANLKLLYVCLAVLFGVNCAIAIGIGVNTAMQFRESAESDMTPIDLEKLDTLYVNVDLNKNIDSWMLAEELKLTEIDINFKPSSDSLFHIQLYRMANGKNKKAALHNAENIIYNTRSEGNNFTIDPYFTLSSNSKIRNQSVSITIFVPENGCIYFGEKLNDYYYDVPNKEDELDRRMTKKFWTMKDHSLTQFP